MVLKRKDKGLSGAATFDFAFDLKVATIFRKSGFEVKTCPKCLFNFRNHIYHRRITYCTKRSLKLQQQLMLQ